MKKYTVRHFSRLRDDLDIATNKFLSTPTSRSASIRLNRLRRDGKVKRGLLEKENYDYDREIDKLKVANGDLSRADFHKKWNGPSQKEFGLGKFFKKSFWQAVRPRHILRRLGYGAVGSLLAGPVGYYVGRFMANQKAWGEETERYGHSFDEDDREFSEITVSESSEVTSSSMNGEPAHGKVKVTKARNLNGHVTGRRVVKRFSSETREKAPEDLIERARKTGVVQKVGDSWRIVNLKKGVLWDAHYASRSKAEAGLRGYQASKH